VKDESRRSVLYWTVLLQNRDYRHCMANRKDKKRRNDALLAMVAKEMAKPRLSASVERIIAKKR